MQQLAQPWCVQNPDEACEGAGESRIPATRVGSVLQEELTYKRYNDWRDVARLISYCFFEHFPYRQMHMIWRLRGIWQYLHGDVAWRPLKRQGLQLAGKD